MSINQISISIWSLIWWNVFPLFCRVNYLPNVKWCNFHQPFKTLLFFLFIYFFFHLAGWKPARRDKKLDTRWMFRFRNICFIFISRWITSIMHHEHVIGSSWGKFPPFRGGKLHLAVFQVNGEIIHVNTFAPPALPSHLIHFIISFSNFRKVERSLWRSHVREERCLGSDVQFKGIKSLRFTLAFMDYPSI